MESIVLSGLMFNERYSKKVLPHLKSSYFHNTSENLIFKIIGKFYQKYNKPPTKEILKEEIESSTVNENLYESSIEVLAQLEKSDSDLEWLVDKTEEFCQEKAIFNAIEKAISITEGEDPELTTHAIPEILKSALSIDFNTSIGHDYFEDAKERWDFYNLEESRIPFDIDILNKITNGGIPKKTLNVILAATNVGKSLMMCHFTAGYLLAGLNVLYITLEMAEEAIANRIDANLFDIDINDIQNLSQDKFLSSIDKVKQKTMGRFIVKEYPTSSIHVGHVRTLLEELKSKSDFTPDVIMIDYINIMSSSRVKLANTNSYFYIKAIAEEIRGLAVEFDLPIWSATQTNRSGANDMDVDLTSTSESFGLPATVDFMFAAIRNDDLDKLGQILIKQLKSRYANKSDIEKFVIGIDPAKAKLYDVEYSAQDGIIQSSGEVININDFSKTPTKKNDFSDIKL